MIEYTPQTITVFCNEDHLVFEGGDPQTSTTGRWIDPLYHNVFTGQPQRVAIPETAEAMQRLPRQKPLHHNRQAYVAYGMGSQTYLTNEKTFHTDFDRCGTAAGAIADQIHLVIDPSTFITQDPTLDRRSATAIIRDGLRPYPYNYLGNIMPLSNIILHEVSSLLTDANFKSY